jgi:o-succinylbenzoate synthase
LIDTNTQLTGIGECSTIPGLSIDYQPNYEQKLVALCERINDCSTPVEIENKINEIAHLPSVAFGLETAWRDLQQGGQQHLYGSDFLHSGLGIPINGLIWMGDARSMQLQIKEKLGAGFSCLKMKIGAIDFEEEFMLLKAIRKNYNHNDLTLRVDANGAFTFEEAKERLKRLAELDIHSIEQPIRAGNKEEMCALCAESPVPIALDEELIGVNPTEQGDLLKQIQPQYIILKPSLVGGIKASEQWIEHAKANRIKYWITSALESNLGLNAIAQWTATLEADCPQGLGTGQLYTNNLTSPLEIRSGTLYYNKAVPWGKIADL